MSEPTRNRALALKEFRDDTLVVLNCPGCCGAIHYVEYPLVIVSAHYRPLIDRTIWMIRVGCPNDPSVILFDQITKDRAMFLALAGAQTPQDEDAEELSISLAVVELSAELQDPEFIDRLKEKES